MRRLLQSVALALVVAFLAPPAFAAFDCQQAPEKTVCAKSCCAGMGAMPMDMSSMAGTATAQLRPSTCCTVRTVEATLPALVAGEGTSAPVVLAMPAPVLLRGVVPVVRATAAEDPPGSRLQEPSLTSLCSFRI